MILLRITCAMVLTCVAGAIAAAPLVPPLHQPPATSERVVSEGLQSVHWTLVEIGGSAGAAGRDGQAPYVTFAADGRFSGSTGCNRMTGSYVLEGVTLTLGPAAATRMACKGDAMQREHAFLRMLESVTGWRVEGNRLHLLGEGGRTLASFAAS